MLFCYDTAWVPMKVYNGMIRNKPIGFLIYLAWPVDIYINAKKEQEEFSNDYYDFPDCESNSLFFIHVAIRSGSLSIFIISLYECVIITRFKGEVLICLLIVLAIKQDLYLF